MFLIGWKDRNTCLIFWIETSRSDNTWLLDLDCQRIQDESFSKRETLHKREQVSDILLFYSYLQMKCFFVIKCFELSTILVWRFWVVSFEGLQSSKGQDQALIIAQALRAHGLGTKFFHYIIEIPLKKFLPTILV